MRVMKPLTVLAFTVCAGLAATATTARAEVRLTMQDGRVSLVAKEATLKQILAEWAKVGQTKIVNGERVPGGPVTLQLTDVPEQQALDILLRSLSGYMAAPRPTAVAGLSRFDRIVVMPTVAAPPSRTASGAPAPVFQPTSNPTVVQAPQPGQAAPPPFLPAADDQEDDRPVVNRNPVFNVFPQPQVGNPLAPMASSPVQGTVPPAQGPLVLPPPASPASAPPTAYPGMPSAPVGVAVPGMVAPAPQQVGRPGQPSQTPQ